MKRLPSISGASPRVRQVAASASTSSTMTSTEVPTRAASLRGADRLGLGHEALPALLLDLLGHVVGEGVGAGAGDVLVLEAADPVELRCVEPVEEVRELGFGLAGIADDEGRAQRDLRALRPPAGDLVERARRRPPGGPCGAARRGGCAGTGCRDRAAPAPRPSAGSARARAGRDRRSGAVPRPRAMPSSRARSVMWLRPRARASHGRRAGGRRRRRWCPG